MYIAAAKHFYRALKVYPNTPELLDIYKKTVPPVSSLNPSPIISMASCFICYIFVLSRAGIVPILPGV
jgi:hypothetical protein